MQPETSPGLEDHEESDGSNVKRKIHSFVRWFCSQSTRLRIKRGKGTARHRVYENRLKRGIARPNQQGGGVDEVVR